MIKTVLKHTLIEHAINVIYDKIDLNFMAVHREIRKVIIKQFHSRLDYIHGAYHTILTYELGKPWSSNIRYDNSIEYGSDLIDRIIIGQPPASAYMSKYGLTTVSAYSKGRLLSSFYAIHDALHVEYIT